MAKFTGAIEEAKAPKAPTTSRVNTEAQAMYDAMIKGTPEGQVGVIELDAGEKVRSVKVFLSRAANRVNRSVNQWDANGKIYFKVVAKKPVVAKKAKTEPAITEPALATAGV